jgi:hypothetical protein
VGVADDVTVRFYRSLAESELERSYWFGIAPDDNEERCYFETVAHDDESVAIRQLTIERGGTSHRYSWQHMEDEWGFLTDRAMGDEITDGTLTPIDRHAFEAAWQSTA